MRQNAFFKWPACLAVLCSLLGFLNLIPAFAAKAQKPNVILILADDLGWTDLACYGSDFYETPHLDQLARDGMKFIQAYSACTVCSPTRAALLTGRHGARKWHLGNEEQYPENHGSDLNVAGSFGSGPPSYFAPYRISTLPDGPKGEYVTDRLADEAARFIAAHKDEPFFLYWPHFAVHTPIQGKPALVEKYKAKLRPGQAQTNAVYAAMVESLDDAVGRMRRTLNELKLSERTIIIFGSDNGGRVPTTSNLPLRVGKGSCYEGGTRVPFIVHWPGVTAPGSVCDTPVISMDVFPTVLEMTGLKKSARGPVDGLSLVPLLRQSGKLKRDTLFWHYPHYQHYQLGGTTPYGAIRAGDFKLLEFFDDMRVELYNLRDDLGEQRNLAAEMPDKAAELRKRLHAWRKEVGAQMPSPNPAYDPSKPEHDPATRQKKPVKKGA